MNVKVSQEEELVYQRQESLANTRSKGQFSSMTDCFLSMSTSVKVCQEEELVYQTWKVWPISGRSLLREPEVSVNYLSPRGAKEKLGGASHLSQGKDKTMYICANLKKIFL